MQEILGAHNAPKDQGVARYRIGYPSEKRDQLLRSSLCLQQAWYLKILTGNGIDALDDRSSCVSSPGGHGFEHLKQRADVQNRRISMNTLMELRKVRPSFRNLLKVPRWQDSARSIPTSWTTSTMTNLATKQSSIPGKFVILQKIIQQVLIEEHKKIIIFSNFEHALTLCEDLFDHFQVRWPPLQLSAPRWLNFVSLVPPLHPPIYS